jgi:hypothetical protein
MGMIKNYLLTLLQQCSEEQFGQDVIQWAIESGRVHISYDLDSDIRSIMSRYDELIETYRATVQQSEFQHRSPAPMQRATPSRKAKTSDSGIALKRSSAA